MAVTILGSIPGQTYAAALGVDGSYIVGEVDDASFNGFAALWDALNPTASPVLLGQIASQTFAYAAAVHGTYIVGEAENPNPHAVLWDATSPTSAPTILGTVAGETNSAAYGVWGTYIVGYVVDGSGSHGALWDASNPTAAPTLLGDIPSQTGATALAVQGTRIVGYAADGSTVQGALWDATSPATAAQRLAYSGGGNGDYALGAYGDVIVGQGLGPSSTDALMWDAASPGSGPTFLPRTGSGADAYAVYTNTIVGDDNGTGVGHGVEWDATNPSNPSVALDEIPNQFGAVAYAISALGVVVGSANDDITFVTVAVMWGSAGPPPNLVEVRIAGTDYTGDVVFATAEFESAVNGANGLCKFRVRDEDRTLSFVTGSIIDLLINGQYVWTGYLTKAIRGYAFPAENVDDAGLTRWIAIEGVDINILFSRRIVFNQSDGANIFGTLYPAHTADNTAIADLVANFLDLSGDSLDTSSQVENVADINEDQEARAWEGGDEWGQAMQSIAALPGAVYFLDPQRRLVYTDVNTADAPFGLSDQPDGVTSVGYREMILTRDANAMANDVFGWGMGYGSNVPVFDRDEDATSISTHGRWQLGQVTSGVYKPATIERIVDSIINGSPSNKRGAKDDRVGATVVTYTPGFLPAQKVDFVSAVWDFEDVIPIRHMRVTFDAPDAPRFELQLSHAIDMPWSFFDPFAFHFGFPPFPPFVFPPFVFPPTLAACPLIVDTWANPTTLPPNTGSGVANLAGTVSAGASGPALSSTLDVTGRGPGTFPGALPGYTQDTIPLAETFDHNEFEIVVPLSFLLSVRYPIIASSRSSDPTDQGHWNYNQLAQGGFWLTFPSGPGVGIALHIHHELFGVVPYPPAFTEYTFSPPTYTTTDTLTGYVSFWTQAGGVIFSDSVPGASGFGGSFIIDRSVTRGTVRIYVPGYGWYEYADTADWSGYAAPTLHFGAVVGPPFVSSFSFAGGHQVEVIAHNLGAFSDDVNFDPNPNTLAFNHVNSTQVLLAPRLCASGTVVDTGTTDFTPDPSGYGCETPNPLDPSTYSNLTYVTGSPFVPNSTNVWRNGLRQVPGTDYTEGTDDQSVVFTTAVQIAEVIRVCYQLANVGT